MYSAQTRTVLALVVLAALGLCSSASAIVIEYDDGTFEAGGARHGEAVRFQMPPVGNPYRIDAVSIWVREYSPTDSQTIHVSIWEDNGGPLAPAAVGDLLYQQVATVTDLQWYTYDVTVANVVIDAGGSCFAGWTSPDWLYDQGDYTDPDGRTLVNWFGTGWADPGAPSPTMNYDAPIRITVWETPEPASAFLLLLGGPVAYWARRRRETNS